jgi:antitoxin component YwqK of YwqJK toxin-antitoxin module
MRLFFFLFLPFSLLSQIKKEKLTYFDNTKDVKYRYFINENDKLEGEFIEYYKNGRKKIDCNYLRDHLSGFYFEYYDNGNVSVEGYFEIDSSNNKTISKPVRTWIYYYENAMIQSKGEFSNMVIDSTFTYIKSNLKENEIISESTMIGPFVLIAKSGLWYYLDKENNVSFINYNNNCLRFLSINHKYLREIWY